MQNSRPLEDPEIIYQDNHLFIVNKPAGLLTQPDSTGQPSLLEICRHWIKVKYQKPGNVFLESVHRLDKPASGIVIFAKTSKALSRLNSNMRDKQVRKVYWALISGKPSKPEGALVHYLIHGDFKASIGKSNDAAAKEARLHYKTLRQEINHTLVEVILETGRYHQIRAQFAAIGCPILGDSKYGGPPFYKNGIALHHAILEIPHPISRELMVFQAPLPWH